MPDRNLLKQCFNKITIDFQDEVSEDDSHMRYTCLKTRWFNWHYYNNKGNAHRQNEVDYR